MILGYALMFACGFLTKLTDNLVGLKPKSSHWAKYASAMGYGLIAAFLIGYSQEFAAIILAVIIAMLFAGKIDARPHQIAVALIFVSILANGLGQVSFPFIAFLAGLALLDEALNDAMDKAKEKGLKISEALHRGLNARPLLELGAIALAIATNNFAWFFAVFSFDLGYNLAGKAFSKN